MTDSEFSSVITTYRPALVAYVLNRGYASRADADDLVQDVLTTIWARHAHHRFRDDSSVVTWLCQCVKQRAIDLRRLRNGPTRREDRAGYTAVQEEIVAGRELREQARDVAATVTDPLIKQALDLWCDGCTWREIAIAVDATPATVRKWVRETVSELAREEKDYEACEAPAQALC